MAAELADVPLRCADAGVRALVGLMTNNQLAAAEIRAAVLAQATRGVVLGGAVCGDDWALGDELNEENLICTLGIRPPPTVRLGAHQPVTPPPPTATSRRCVRVWRDVAYSPLSARTLAQARPARVFCTGVWRQGSAEELPGRFARVRVVTTHGNCTRDPEWLVIKWPRVDIEPTCYWFATLPEETTFKALVDKDRWGIECDHLKLKEERGPDHYEGRNRRGFPHQASLCIAVYDFLAVGRLRGSKNSVRDPLRLRYPKASVRAGAGTNAAVAPPVGRRHAPPPRRASCHAVRAAAGRTEVSDMFRDTVELAGL